MKGQPNRLLQITVIGDADSDANKNQIAYQTGRLIASNRATLITGGKGGVMEAASKGAFENNGFVVGIVPGNLPSDANSYCHLVIPTGMGHARNTITVLAADIIIVIGGGAGTLSEIAFAWIYEKPILALDFVDGWSERLADQKIDSRIRDKIIRISSIEMLQKKLEQYKSILE